MNGFKPQTFADRRGAANDARQAALERFRAKTPANDAELAARLAVRQELAAARDARIADKATQKKLEEERAELERIARAEQEKIDKAERQIREAEEQVVLEAERKAARDARFAARKARKA